MFGRVLNTPLIPVSFVNLHDDFTQLSSKVQTLQFFLYLQTLLILNVVLRGDVKAIIKNLKCIIFSKFLFWKNAVGVNFFPSF